MGLFLSQNGRTTFACGKRTFINFVTNCTPTYGSKKTIVRSPIEVERQVAAILKKKDKEDYTTPVARHIFATDAV